MQETFASKDLPERLVQNFPSHSGDLVDGTWSETMKENFVSGEELIRREVMTLRTRLAEVVGQGSEEQESLEKQIAILMDGMLAAKEGQRPNELFIQALDNFERRLVEERDQANAVFNDDFGNPDKETALMEAERRVKSFEQYRNRSVFHKDQAA